MPNSGPLKVTVRLALSQDVRSAKLDTGSMAWSQDIDKLPSKKFQKWNWRRPWDSAGPEQVGGDFTISPKVKTNVQNESGSLTRHYRKDSTVANIALSPILPRQEVHTASDPIPPPYRQPTFSTTGDGNWRCEESIGAVASRYHHCDVLRSR